MAGIDFMALANGMMLGDKLNKEDESYWRKQAQEDRNIAFQERDQAYKEKQQGYTMTEWEQQAQGREGNRLVSQANDIYQKAARAQDKPLWQVLIESPEFTVPGADENMQAHVSAGIRSGIVSKVAMDLRQRGEWRNSDALLQKFGMSQSSQGNTLALLSDPQALNAATTSAGMSRGPNGKYQVAGVELTDIEAAGIALNPASAVQTLLNKQKINEANTTNQGIKTAAEQAHASALDTQYREMARAAIARGDDPLSIPPGAQEYYYQMKAAKIPSSRADLVGSTAGSIGTYTDQANSSTAPVATKTIAPAMPTTPIAAPATPPVSWRDAVSEQNVQDLNHKSTAELTMLRNAVKKALTDSATSPIGSGIGASWGAYLKIINTEIASRHAAEAKQFQQRAKQ